MAVERSQAQQGRTVRLRLRFTAGGTLFDPFQVRLAEIRDDSNALIETLPAGSIVRDGIGRYHVDWGIPDDEPESIHHDRWYATATDGATEKQFTLSFLVLPATDDGTSAAAGAWLTLPGLRAYVPDASTTTDEQLIALMALAQETIEWICGQRFLPLSEARTFDGNGRRVMSVMRPIMSISNVSVLACGIGDPTTIDVSGVRIARYGTMLALGNAQRYSDAIRGNGSYPPWHGWPCGVFPSGFQNIQVTGSWGRFATVPLQIQNALGTLVRYALQCDDPLAMPTAALSGEMIPFHRSYTMREVWHLAHLNGSTGYPDVDAVLARFRRSGTVGFV